MRQKWNDFWGGKELGRLEVGAAAELPNVSEEEFELNHELIVQEFTSSDTTVTTSIENLAKSPLLKKVSNTVKQKNLAYSTASLPWMRIQVASTFVFTALIVSDYRPSPNADPRWHCHRFYKSWSLQN